MAMHRKGAVPEEVSIEVFILTFAASGRQEQALAVFAEFLTCRSEVGIGSYSTRLMECEQRGLLSTGRSPLLPGRNVQRRRPELLVVSTSGRPPGSAASNGGEASARRRRQSKASWSPWSRVGKQRALRQD